MDNRTYDAIAERMSLLQRLQDELATVRAELDAERNAHNATAAQLYAELADAQDTATAAVQAWRTVTAERDALRAEFVSYQEHAKTFACKLKDELDVTRFKLDNERNKNDHTNYRNDRERCVWDDYRAFQEYPEYLS